MQTLIEKGVGARLTGWEMRSTYTVAVIEQEIPEWYGWGRNPRCSMKSRGSVFRTEGERELLVGVRLGVLQFSLGDAACTLPPRQLLWEERAGTGDGTTPLQSLQQHLLTTCCWSELSVATIQHGWSSSKICVKRIPKHPKYSNPHVGIRGVGIWECQWDCRD